MKIIEGGEGGSERGRVCSFSSLQVTCNSADTLNDWTLGWGLNFISLYIIVANYYIKNVDRP